MQSWLKFNFVLIIFGITSMLDTAFLQEILLCRSWCPSSLYVEVSFVIFHQTAQHSSDNSQRTYHRSIFGHNTG